LNGGLSNYIALWRDRDDPAVLSKLAAVLSRISTAEAELRRIRRDESSSMEKA